MVKEELYVTVEAQSRYGYRIMGIQDRIMVGELFGMPLVRSHLMTGKMEGVKICPSTVFLLLEYGHELNNVI